MSIPFQKVKSFKLAPTDQILTGKFQGFRVCDIWEKEWQYLSWAFLEHLLDFDKVVLLKIDELAEQQLAELYHNYKPTNPDDATDPIPY